MTNKNLKKLNRKNNCCKDGRTNTRECGKKRKKYVSETSDIGKSPCLNYSTKSGKDEGLMDIFVSKSYTEKTLIKLNPVIVKNQRDGFKYIGVRCRVAVSMNKIRKSENNLCSSFNWVEGVIKYWDPKFKLFFIHFILAPSINTYSDSNIPMHEWKHLVTQYNSPPAESAIHDLKLSPYALDRGWFSANPSTLKYYGDNLIIVPTPKTKKKCKEYKQNIFVCAKCNSEIVNDSFVSCSICKDIYHCECKTVNENSIQDLKDNRTKCIRKYCNLTESKLIEIAKDHCNYLREMKKKLNNSLPSSSFEALNVMKTELNETQIPFDLVNIEEIERIIPLEAKKIIMENYNLPHAIIRKMLSKLPNKIGISIGDHQIKLLCRNYRYNKRNNSRYTVDQAIKDDIDQTKVTIGSGHFSPKNNLTDSENTIKEANETEFRCRDCMTCIYCNNSLLNEIPILLKPNELPNRSILYTQIPTKIQDFVVCSICGICFHGCCANLFIPPLLLGGDYFKCSNCCICLHCGYRDAEFIDCTSWDSTFTTCIRCCKGLEKGQFCSICKKVWSFSWEGQWLKCDICSFWVHYECDQELDKPMEYYSKNSNSYSCPVCRSQDNKVKFQRILDNITFLDKNKDFSLIPPPTYHNYWKVVKTPIDMVTIQRKLDDNHYETNKFLFIEDIYRMIHNAQISHMPNHRIYRSALNILKKTNKLYKMLFGGDSLDSFYKNISSNHDSITLSLREVTTKFLNGGIDDSKICTLNNDFFNDKWHISTKSEQSMDDFIRTNIIDKFNFLFSEREIHLNECRTKQLFKLHDCHELNKILIDLFKSSNRTFNNFNAICTKCGEQVDEAFVANNGENQCNSCTRCSHCKIFMSRQSIPTVSCSACNKKIHYSCLWQESSNNKNSHFKTVKKNILKTCGINNKDIEDNKDFECLWKLYSSFASPNKSTALINTPLTAISGRGYYQYISADIYICNECDKNVTESIFIKENLKLNNIIRENIFNIQNILKIILSKEDDKIRLNPLLKKIVHILVDTNLDDTFFINTNNGNVIICNICSMIFYCKDFTDLEGLAFERELCTSSFNFTCSGCRSKVLNMDNLYGPFPPVLNTLISTSQFRIKFSKDIHLIASLILNLLFSSVANTVKLVLHESDIAKLRKDIVKKYLKSKYSITTADNIRRSSLIQWYLYYIQQNRVFDFSKIAREYLQCFYKEQIGKEIEELIVKNTLSLIVNSIENMVLSNKYEADNFINNAFHDTEFINRLNSYLILFIKENQTMEKMDTNFLNYQSFIDVKTFTDIENSFRDFYSNYHLFNKCDHEQLETKKLKNEIMNGLSLIKNQIMIEYKNINANSIFTILYYLILHYIKKESTSGDLCHYCGITSNILLGDLLTSTKINNIKIHKECILWSLPFSLEPILNNIGMGYESKFDVKEKKDTYIPKFSTFGKVSWPVVRNPILIDTNDVMITLNDMNILKCELCSIFGATIKCSGNDTCYKYYHLDCLFNHYFKSQVENYFNFSSSYITLEAPENSINSVNIRMKYRRVWCEECWPIYKKIIEPKPDITEGLTGGIMHNFSKLLFIDIRFINEPQILEASPTIHIDEEATCDFLGNLINKLDKMAPSNSSISRLKSFLQKIADSNTIKEPFVSNNSVVVLNSGEIVDEKNIVQCNGEILFVPNNYSSIRIWRSPIIFNNIFCINQDFTVFHCSITNYGSSIEFQIDWVPDQRFKDSIIRFLKLKNEYNESEMYFNAGENLKGIFLFKIPLLRGCNIERLYSSFLKLMRINSGSSNNEMNYLICPKSLIYSIGSTENQTLFNDTIFSDGKCDSYYAYLFFGVREEFIYKNLKAKMYKFYLNKFISIIYCSNFAIDILHPEIWTSHRHRNFDLKNQRNLVYEYSLLGRNESKKVEIDREKFAIIFENENIDLENSEIMNITSSHSQDTRKKKLKVEDMAPSMLYRYLDSFPYDKRLEIKKSSIHGYGLFAKETINPGEPIIEYVGELIRNSIADKRENSYNSEDNWDGSCYMFRLDETRVIDATNIGNHARFMNHSCDPNSLCKVINIDSDNKHIVVFSKKLIEKDEEITYDYQFNVEEASEKILCHCGSNNCLGRMN
ncbi:multidomain chromatinic with the following architecture [Cryptosporidium bovis]|uniref:multidomain chromatinic with the following architecture n=1 Tax=Cryptosporidium bovis TaxID=310047 RepID=UPI00351A260B|nr:multidomain chromatinic with the following architecture [Cryptosporidium bovis]